MAEFPSYHSYFRFVSHAMKHNRHFPSVESQAFLDALWATSGSRVVVFPAGKKFCRARLGCDYVPYEHEGNVVYEEPAPFSGQEMIPLLDRAHEGRANPKGIPCLYVPSHWRTAIAEVRPWIGAFVTVAIFSLNRDLQVVDCSKDQHHGIHIGQIEPSAEVREAAAWSHVNNAFRRPVTRNDDESSYAPTQIIADLFKSKNLDGVAYGSAVGEGVNVALFDLACATPLACRVYEIKNVTVNAELIEGAYEGAGQKSLPPLWQLFLFGLDNV
jgi:RES domain-containing protein